MNGDLYIGQWTVQPRRNVVRGLSGEARVRPRTMAVLVQLAAACGDVVDKRDLMDAVWGSAVVSEDVLTQAIVELRRAFDDDARRPRVIETIHSVGFRLLPEVRASKPTSRGTAGRRVAAAVAMLAAGVAFLSWLAGLAVIEHPRALSGPSVAVLPFENLSPNPDDAYFAAGIHDEIINQLAKLSALRVIPREPALRYTDAGTSIEEIAHALNVETVLVGSIRYADNQVRISARLIDPGTGGQLWSDTYDRAFDDIFAIQSDIAIEIANALEAEFSADEQERIERIPTSSPAAYALYLRSLRESGDDAIDILDRAIALDPDFALAHAAKAYRHAYGTTDGAQQEPIIRDSAERALDLDPTLGLAHAALGYVHRSNWHWGKAREAFEHAVALSPNDPSVLAAAGRLSRRMGEYGKGAWLGRRAVELDSDNDVLHYQLGITLRYARDYDAAYRAFGIAADLDPAEPGIRIQLALAEIMRGNRARAASELQMAEQLLAGSPVDEFRIAQLAYAHAQLGRREDVMRHFERLEALEQERPVDHAIWALAHIAVGDYERALSRLVTAIGEQSPGSILALTEIKANASRDPVLEEDPRFVAARASIGAD